MLNLGKVVLNKFNNLILQFGFVILTIGFARTTAVLRTVLLDYPPKVSSFVVALNWNIPLG